MRYFIHLAYKGTHYRGWQRQAEAPSVQQVVEEKLSEVLSQSIHVHPCGRTDAGVHASQFFVHFSVEKAIDFDFVFRMNKKLPNDIAVYDLLSVPEKANAQLDATARTYRYYFHLNRNPFWEEGSTWYPLENFDIEKAKQLFPLLKKYNDFRSMCLKPDTHNHTLCTIEYATLESLPDGRFCFEIKANRFLRGMVRLLVGRLLDIGTGKISIQEFENCLQTGERVEHHTLAYPQGLYLAKVEYPFFEIEPKGI